jgi:hypothetical protein
LRANAHSRAHSTNEETLVTVFLRSGTRYPAAIVQPKERGGMSRNDGAFYNCLFVVIVLFLWQVVLLWEMEITI